MWDSGLHENPQQLWIPYQGEALRSDTAYRWQVEARVNGTTKTSAWASFTTALLNPEDWKARWIGADAARLVGREGFTQRPRLVPQSRIPEVPWVPDAPYIDQWLAAATMGSHRLPTEKLREGRNAIGALVGEGWHGESDAYATLHQTLRYGPPGLIAQLELLYADGTRERVTTDATWQATLEGPLLKNGIWCGTVYDARRRRGRGWTTCGRS